MNQLIDPALAGSMAESADVAAHQRKLDAMRRELNSGAPKDKKEKLREACEGFEAVFIQKMWEQMRATVPQESPLHSKDEKIWQGMYDQELSKKMAGAGGIGLADMMMAQLGRNLEDAGQKAVNSSLNRNRSEAMPIAPAPLLLDAMPAGGGQKPAVTSSAIYSGAAAAVAEGEGDLGEIALAPVDPQSAPPEFDALVSDLQAAMQQPVVTMTRITTNASSISAFNTLKGVRSGKGQSNPRVIRHTAPQNVPQALTPQASPVMPQQAAFSVMPQPLLSEDVQPAASDGVAPQISPSEAMLRASSGPTLSPAAVNQTRTAALASVPRYRR